MDFQTLSKKVSPKLKRIATRHKDYVSFVDEEDLYQEMLIHLWNNFKDGVPSDINEAYIVRGCEFHILNYLRKTKENIKILSLETPINEDGDTLKDILSIENENDSLDIYERLSVEEIKKDLSKKEKKTLSLLLEGYTLREVGRKLGVSHVRIVKLKQDIIKKWRAKVKR